MKIIKLLKDYSKSANDAKLCEFLSEKFPTGICEEEIKNKKFMIQYIQPINDFIIHTTALPCTNARRMLY